MVHDSLKRLIDLVGAFFGLIIFSPVMLILAILIRLESSGPSVFTQPRVTREGKVFMMFKFRSMFVNADEEILHTNPKLLKKYQENGWKLSLDEDPRVTKIGRFIRKTSLDELPQFFNVLIGEMSLVGPRAFRPEELAEQIKKFPQSSPDVNLMLTAKPGITGPWQVGSRNSVDFVERVRMDANYAKKRSVWYDLLIMAKTPFRIIHKES